MLGDHSINVVGQTTDRCAALRQQEKTPSIVLFRDSDVDHGNLKIGASSLDVKQVINQVVS